MECLYCKKGYTLNSLKECIPCEEGCNYCYLDNSNNTVCLYCNISQYKMFNKKCFGSPKGCYNFEFNSDNNQTVCSLCRTEYILDSETNQCQLCKDIIDTGIGCKTCSYNTSNKKYECNSCLTSYTYGQQTTYAYVENTFQCLSNKNANIKGLYGCLKAIYIEDTETYECLKCINYYDDYFIPVITDKSCVKPNSVGLSNECLEAEKIDDKYSCLKCKDNYALIEDFATSIKKCYERNNTLRFCLEGRR
jgi:hypothetical protein